MIYGNLAEAWRYSGVHPLFEKAFAALQKYFEEMPPVGKHVLEGDALYASAQTYVPKQRVEDAPFEAHRKYIDVQFLVSGEEEMDVLRLGEGEETRAYDAENDYALYRGGASYTTLSMRPGFFAILFPEDLHRPGVVSSPKEGVQKIVVKVAVE